jgi:N-acetylmuramoyl-L-alanine amidase
MKSPNFDDRPVGVDIDTIVYHYTGMRSAEEALERLCNQEAKVSAHYVVLEDGEIIQLVDESKRAWHAGVSSWRGRQHVNNFSIGIEIVNPGHEFGYEEFPITQIESVVRLSHEIFERNPIENLNVVGHSDIAPSRKNDPGELFPWRVLAEEGIGIWPDIPPEFDDTENEIDVEFENDINLLQTKLIAFGYGLEETGVMDVTTKFVIKAFQRRFTPYSINGRWTAKENYILERLLWQIA